MSNTSLHAIIVEDDKHLGVIFQAALQGAGFETELITDGQLASIRLDSSEPDLILLDLHLPQIDGIELLAQIRQRKETMNTTVILASADQRLADAQSHADYVMIKPVSYDQLKRFASRLKLRINH